MDLFQTDACLIQVHFSVLACFGNRIHACLIKVACEIEVATKTGFTVFNIFEMGPTHQNHKANGTISFLRRSPNIGASSIKKRIFHPCEAFSGVC